MESANKTFDYDQYRQIRERSVGRLLWRMKRYMDGFMEPRLQALGFTDFKMSYLMLLAHIEEQGTTNNELARKACVTKQMMSKIVGLLESENYIYSQKNPADSRSSILFLNERGKELFVALRDVIEEVRQKFDSIVGHDQMEQVIDTMIKLADTLESEAV